MAANLQRGEVSITIDKQAYTLVLDMDAMCALEAHFQQALGKEIFFPEIIEKAEKGSMVHLRGLLWCCLLRHQPKIQIGDINALVMHAGGLAPFTVTLMQLVKASEPDPKDVAALGVAGPEGGGKVNPPVAQADRAGTGEGSTSSPAASA